MSKRILITGHEGYIGSVMAPFFLDAGYEVVGLDAGFFQECTLLSPRVQIPTLLKDIREVKESDLEGFDVVVHLAALSNDALGKLNSRWTKEINYEAAVHLAKCAKSAGVKRFLFSSSCIMYGMSEVSTVTEESPLNPQTDYAVSKMKCEREIAKLAGDDFSPTFLRNGTVYGLSPRMRFDTVYNNLMGMAVTTGKIVIHGDGRPWRPVIHVEDVARSFLAVLEAPISVVHNQIFNNGANHLNHQIKELAQTVLRTVPDCKLETLSSPDADPRTYQADFSKFARAFPDFIFKWDIHEGAKELYNAFKAAKLTQAHFNDKRFTRIQWINYLLETKRLDSSLRWNHKVGIEP